MSRIITVGFDELLPTQPYVFDDVIDMRVHDIMTGESAPFHLVPHPDGLNLMVDGHHRVYSHYRLGNTAMETFLHETDNDIASNQHVDALHGCGSVEEVIRRYETRWLPHSRKFGVTNIDDLFSYPPIRSSVFLTFWDTIGRLVEARKKEP